MQYSNSTLVAASVDILVPASNCKIQNSLICCIKKGEKQISYILNDLWHLSGNVEYIDFFVTEKTSRKCSGESSEINFSSSECYNKGDYK